MRPGRQTAPPGRSYQPLQAQHERPSRFKDRRSDRRLARGFGITIGGPLRCPGSSARLGPAGRMSAGRGSTGCSRDVRGDDVGGVPVQRGPGPVVTHRGTRIGVGGGFLYIPQRHPGVQRCGDERVPQRVGPNRLGDPGPVGTYRSPCYVVRRRAREGGPGVRAPVAVAGRRGGLVFWGGVWTGQAEVKGGEVYGDRRLRGLRRRSCGFVRGEAAL